MKICARSSRRRTTEHKIARQTRRSLLRGAPFMSLCADEKYKESGRALLRSAALFDEISAIASGRLRHIFGARETLPPPLKGTPRQGAGLALSPMRHAGRAKLFSPIFRRVWFAKKRSERRESAETPEGDPSAELRAAPSREPTRGKAVRSPQIMYRVWFAKSEARDGDLPKPLKGSPRQSAGLALSPMRHAGRVNFSPRFFVACGSQKAKRETGICRNP